MIEALVTIVLLGLLFWGFYERSRRKTDVAMMAAERDAAEGALGVYRLEAAPDRAVVAELRRVVLAEDTPALLKLLATMKERRP